MDPQNDCCPIIFSRPGEVSPALLLPNTVNGSGTCLPWARIRISLMIAGLQYVDIRNGTIGCCDVEAIVQMPLRAVFLQLASCNACRAPHLTFLFSLHPVFLANPSSALREQVPSNRAPQSFATLAVASNRLLLSCTPSICLESLEQ